MPIQQSQSHEHPTRINSRVTIYPFIILEFVDNFPNAILQSYTETTKLSGGFNHVHDIVADLGLELDMDKNGVCYVMAIHAMNS